VTVPPGKNDAFTLGSLVAGVTELGKDIDEIRKTTVTKDYLNATVDPMKRLMWIVITAVVGVIVAVFASSALRTQPTNPAPVVNVIIPTAHPTP
jgi:hypothetical protein